MVCLGGTLLCPAASWGDFLALTQTILRLIISDCRWKALSFAQCKAANHSVWVEFQAVAADVDESIESKLKSIESKLKSIESNLKSIESKLKSIQSKLKSIESKLKSKSIEIYHFFWFHTIVYPLE